MGAGNGAIVRPAYVYIWADGVDLQARMEPQAECMLVLIGATPEGKKELLGFQVGMREERQSWRELRSTSRRAASPSHPSWRPATGRRLLEGARGGVADNPAPALYCAQDRERARQAAQIRPASGQG